MNTELCEATAEHIAHAGELIRAGGLVAFPTETVYGLGGDAFRADSAKKIYAAKGRPSDNPLIVHIAELSAACELSDELPDSFYRLAEVFWPGPLTMIVKKRSRLPDETTGGLPSVAIRLPDHPVAQQLIAASGGFVAAPSANTSGRPSPTLASHVAEDLDGRIEMILDGGEVGIGLESTIVDLCEGVPTVLRPGYIAPERIKEVLGSVSLDSTILNGAASGRPKAPGMRYRHYAPRGHMCVFYGSAERVAVRINEIAAASPEHTAVLCTDESRSLYTAGRIESLGSRSDLRDASRRLYRYLRDFDAAGITQICAEALPAEGLGLAVMNRMLKAAGYELIEL